MIGQRHSCPGTAVRQRGGQAPSRSDPRPGSGVLLLSETAAGALEAVFSHQVATRSDRPFTSAREPDAPARADAGSASNGRGDLAFVGSAQRERLVNSAQSA